MPAGFGEICQLGYVVPDLDAAVDHWARVFGVGPFFVSSRVPYAQVHYKGAPSDVEISVALASHRGMQIEIIQQVAGGPSMFSAFVDRTGGGLHHVCSLTDDLEADVAAWQARGVGVLMGGTTTAGVPFAYLDTDPMDQGRVPRAPIWIERAHESEIAETLSRAGVESAPRRPVLTATMLFGSLDRAARGFHEAYTTYAKQSNPWEDLDENFRNANRRAADHAKTKLEALGLTEKVNSNMSEADLRKLVEANLEPLAMVEHDSWSIDRLFNGWQYGPERDDTARLHPSLIPYEELDQYQKDLDRWQVEQLPKIVGK